MLSIELPGRRKIGRPQKRLMDILKEDVWMVGVTEQGARDKVR